ncbi:MAG: hypothetical protein FVQ82_06175 [Planctomycetes bacterium]|nr:hypothetical protein [Planctomycetota bacterium]
MTIRRDLVKAAVGAKGVLGESTGLVAEFLKSQVNPDGGFRGRSSESDLYYTMFGVEAMTAVSPGFSCEPAVNFLRRFKGTLDKMEMVDLACYLRCMADVSDSFSFNEAWRLMEVFSTPDGGYNVDRSAERGTAYGCFLALGAFQDSGLEVRRCDRLVDCLNSLKTESGGYSNEYGITAGSTPATAAAVSALYFLGGEIGDDTVDWMLSRVSPEGGFLAMENAPITDLLSTATGLYALRLAGADISDLRERCLDFVDSLWDGKGGFCGNSLDKVCDCEYTFYGLLALGLLNKQ